MKTCDFNLCDLELDQSVKALKEINRDLEAKVEARAKENRTYLRTLCHDLDTPLQLALHEIEACLITGSTSTLKRAYTAIQNVASMVGKARDSQSMQDGKQITHISEFDMMDLMRETVDGMMLRLCDKDIQVSIEGPVNLTARSDPAVLRDHVFSNILTNAIKFSRRGANIQIKISTDSDGSSVIAFRDEGIGIPKNLMAQIFDFQAFTSRPGTQGEKGTGYGMPLIKQYLENIGGRIRVESKTISESPFDHGTTVTVVLPLGT